MADRRYLFSGGLVIVGAIPVLIWPQSMGHGWLAALFFWSAVPVGSIGFLMVMRLVGGGWREALGRAMVQGTVSLPVAAIAAAPILLAMHALYSWSHITQPGFRGWWLAPVPFVLRTFIWFAGLAAIMIMGIQRRFAVIGLLFLIPIGSLIAVDWLMSLDSVFHSSGFGLQALEVQFTIALMVAVLRAPSPEGITGALMLTLLMLWGYFAYLPFFIIWSGNAPAGAAWYLARGTGGWGAVATIAVTLHMIPLLALLSPGIRHSARGLKILALIVLVGDAAQAAWLVLPVDGPLQLPGVVAFLWGNAALGGATWLTGRRI